MSAEFKRYISISCVEIIIRRKNIFLKQEETHLA